MKKILLIIIVLFAALPVQGAFAAKLLEYKFASPVLVNQLEISGTGDFISISTYNSPSHDSSLVLSNSGTLPFQISFGRTIYGLVITMNESASVTKVVFKKDNAVITPDIISQPTPTPAPTPTPKPTPTPMGGLLDGKRIIDNRGYQYDTYFLTDNDINTGISMSASSYGNNYTRTASYIFPVPVDVDHYYIYSTQTTPSDSYALSIKFYDSNDAIIRSLSPVIFGTKYKISVTKNVKKIVLEDQGVSDVRGIKEFNVFGSVSPVSTPTPTNTDSSLFVINNLDKTVDSSASITLNWSPINSVYLKHYKVYQDDVLIGTVNTNSISVSGLAAGQTSVFKVAPVDTFDKEFAPSALSYTVPIPDVTPPGIPKNIKVVPDRYNASMTWDAPPDPDLLGYYVYLDGVRVNASPQLTNSYLLSALEVDKEYAVSVVSVDVSGNLSEKSPPVKFRTLTLQTAPAMPSNFTGYAFYKGANLSWLPVSSAAEYAVYMDDVKLFTTVNTYVKVNNLVNGKDYRFQVSAINDIGESDLSDVLLIHPKDQSVVDVNIGYSLKDISDSTASMFGANWPLVAFAISIPLSFIVALGVKRIFVG